MPSHTPPDDLLPTPTPKEVRRFREISRDRHGVDIGEAAALRECTRLLQFAYLWKVRLGQELKSGHPKCGWPRDEASECRRTGPDGTERQD